MRVRRLCDRIHTSSRPGSAVADVIGPITLTCDWHVIDITLGGHSQPLPNHSSIHSSKTLNIKRGRQESSQNASFMVGATLMGTKSWFLNVYWSAISKRWVSICFKQKKILVLPSSHKWNERLKKTGPVMFFSPGSCSYLILTKANPRASTGFQLGSRLMNEYDDKLWKGFVSSFLEGWGRGGDSQQSLLRSENGEGLPQSLEEKLQWADHITHLASSLTPLHS